MEAIRYLTSWSGYLLAIIPAGAICMVGYQALRKSLTNDACTIDDANVKIKNTLIGAAVGITISGFITVMRRFY